VGAVSKMPIRRARVLVADDHPLIRVSCMAMVNRQRDLVCCGEAGSTVETRNAVQALQPDLVLLDLLLDGADGLELIKSLKSQFPRMYILVFSQLDEGLYAERALRAGASGYILKTQTPKEVTRAIRTVLAGEIYVSAVVAARLLHKVIETKRESCDGRTAALTDRELKVLQLLGVGMSTRKIAEELTLSFKTIETHRENIKRKLGLHDAAELVCFGTQWVRAEIFSSSRDLSQSRPLRPL